MKRITACFALLAALIASQAAPASQPGTAQISVTKSVDIDGFKFLPKTLSVVPGTKVVFSNSSGTAHTATGGAFDTGRIRPGRAAAVRFGRSGTFKYHCKIHPFMRGKVVVG
jgi:plastocyanin